MVAKAVGTTQRNQIVSQSVLISPPCGRIWAAITLDPRPQTNAITATVAPNICMPEPKIRSSWTINAFEWELGNINKASTQTH